MKNSYANRGKDAEGEAVEWLEHMSQMWSSFAYHRYPDSRSARAPLPKQPSDYLVAYGDKRLITHLEVKETGEKYRLPKSKVTQYGKLMLFWWAGIQPRVLVKRTVYRDWVFFTEDHLFRPVEGTVDDTLKSFPFSGLASCPTAEAALRYIYNVDTRQPWMTSK